MSILILSKAYPTSGYNLAHITRHARLLVGGYFAEIATRGVSLLSVTSRKLTKINHALKFCSVVELDPLLGSSPA